jgi:hypothetical protein
LTTIHDFLLWCGLQLKLVSSEVWFGVDSNGLEKGNVGRIHHTTMTHRHSQLCRVREVLGSLKRVVFLEYHDLIGVVCVSQDAGTDKAMLVPQVCQRVVDGFPEVEVSDGMFD